MAIENTVKVLLSQLFTSRRVRDSRRTVTELKRVVRKGPHLVDIFLRVSDPYSLVLLQGIQELSTRFLFKFRVHIVQNLDPNMFPEPELLDAWGVRDADYLAKFYGFDWNFSELPTADVEAAAIRLAVAQLEFSSREQSWHSEADLQAVLLIFQRAWQGDASLIAEGQAVTDPNEQLKRSEAALTAEGHYLPGMLKYGGEWYWGVSRLNYLEQRLWDLGLSRGGPKQFVYERRFTELGQVATAAHTSAETEPLEFFFSARSPYSYLALQRCFELADRCQIPLTIRLVLPMVMRNLKVPTAKRFYIASDAKREADSLAVPFGKISDPLGAGVERCYAVAAYAREQGLEREWLLRFATAVWSEGVNAASDSGLRSIVEAVGLDWNKAKAAVADDSWRSEVEKNRSDMLEAGSWGVPTFRYKGVTVWGQDRFWVLERLISGEWGQRAEPDAPLI